MAYYMYRLRRHSIGEVGGFIPVLPHSTAFIYQLTIAMKKLNLDGLIIYVEDMRKLRRKTKVDCYQVIGTALGYGLMGFVIGVLFFFHG